MATLGLVGIDLALVPPNANLRSGFEPEFLENVLHVFLHGARAASQNFSDLAVAFSGSDPFRDFELALGKGMPGFEISGRALLYFG